MKYAVIEINNRQHKVTEGEELAVDKLEGKKGEKLTFDKVLLLIDEKKRFIGQPLVKGAKVTAEIIEQFKDKKIRVATYKAKSRYRKVKGHRSQLTKIKINKISLSKSSSK
ncbi:MAG TPA: 50S ribosomal protein L21 [Patescibacteria group bacterium]|nr:50S ribosomal protein L21 [Patescibacteria group bacterium]